MANRERVARLEALLARVRANARPGSLLSAAEALPADDPTDRPVPMVPPPIVDDRWSTVLDEPEDRSPRFVLPTPPVAPAPLPEPSVELGEVVTFDEAPIVPPAPIAPAVATEPAPATLPSYRPSMLESSSEPTSALAEAIERVARELKPAPGEPGAIWSRSGDDMRARRAPSTPPAALDAAEPQPASSDAAVAPPEPAALSLDRASASLEPASVSIEPASVALPAAGASMAPSASVPPGALRRLRQRVRRSAARRRARAPATRAQRAAVAAVVGALALVGVWRFWSPGRDASPAPAERVASSESARGVAVGATGDAPAPMAASRDVAPATSRPTEPTPRPEAETSFANEPDVAELAPNQGWLRVDGSEHRLVYLNGSRAGETGSWLRVSCGWRYARVAEPGPPPVGRSFPMWSSDGVPVLVPCRGRTSVRLER